MYRFLEIDGLFQRHHSNSPELGTGIHHTQVNHFQFHIRKAFYEIASLQAEQIQFGLTILCLFIQDPAIILEYKVG